MIKLTSCDIDGGNQRVIWINVHHIISVEQEKSRTMVQLPDGVFAYVTESVDDIIGTMGYDDEPKA